MALPTLPSFLELKKVNFNQELLRNKHANEFDNMEKWSNTRKYFQTTNNLSNQHTNWTSDKSFNTSMFAYSQQQENSEAKLTERLQKMSERRSKLRALLDREKITQEAELKSMRTAPVGHVGASVPGVPSGNIGSGGIPATLEVLRNRAEALKSAKEESRRKLAEQKLYENWRSNHPELRELESKKMEEHVVGAWSEQLKEKSELAKAEKRQDEEYLAYLEAERQRQEDRDEELRRLKLSREVELKELLKQQMIELRQREAETEVCKREELSLAKQRDDIDMLLEERRQIAQRSQKEEYGRQLLRQHKAKLRQRARQVQEELEFDMKILAAMNESKLEERYAESARKEQARADAQKMLQVLNEQLRLEKIREAELDAMFADEAAREWEKRAVEWEKEREAREQLMRQVMQERAMQLGEKSSLLAEKKAESLQKRAELLRDMELTQVMLKREKEKTELAKQDRRKELDKAVEEMGLESRLKDEIANDVGQIEMERMELNDADKMLDVEKAKIVDEPFKPKSFGRKKVAWT